MITKNLTSEFKKLACSYDGLILEKLGFTSITPRGVMQSCPVHGGNNPAGFSYDRSRCCWSCFTHGCHQKFGNDIIGLVRALKNCSFTEAVQWMELIINDPEISAGYIVNDIVEAKPRENSSIDESFIDRLYPDFSSILDRGFNQSTLKHFQCGVSSEKSKIQHRRLMIPIRDIDGKLIGFTGRSIYNKCDRTGSYHPEWSNDNGAYSSVFSKWRHYPKGLNKSVELYNLNEAKRYIDRIGFVVVVEGPFDLWRLWELGVKNCVASFGCSLSREQINKLKPIASCIAVCFDDDKPGSNGFEKAKILYDKDIKIEKLTLPRDNDPGAISLEDYNYIIKPQLSVLRSRYENKNHNNNW